jgi:DNA-binding MarR family transcriptional regulator/GNAT superfamily N-acetyltransferase
MKSKVPQRDEAEARGDTEGGEAVDAIRGFNRFYTRQLGLLDQGLLGSELNLTEARVMYELANRDSVISVDIANELGIDFGYLSRMLRKFERRKYIARVRSPTDARQSWLTLTKEGREAFRPLDRAAKDQIQKLIDPMNGDERADLVKAMQSVKQLLHPERAVPPPRYILRSLEVGDIGWITYRQGMLYAREYDWDQTYEALVAEILSGFVKNFDSRYEQAWIAVRKSEIVGSVFLVRASASVAQLRLLYVEPEARGMGLGKQLVWECINAARAKGYSQLTLWTNDILVSARRIYEAAGFRLMSEEPQRSFGKDLVGQHWELAL